MANKITNLRNWINGEVFNARDYTYERNLIVALVNNHEDRVTALEVDNTTSKSNIAANTANIATNTGNISVNANKILDLETFTDNLENTFLDKETTDPQVVAGPITFNSSIILNGTNLDSELETLSSRVGILESESSDYETRITALEDVPEQLGQNTFVQENEPTEALVSDLWFDTN